MSSSRLLRNHFSILSLLFSLLIGAEAFAEKVDPVKDLQKFNLNEAFLKKPPKLREMFTGEQVALAHVSPINDTFCFYKEEYFVACFLAIKAMTEAGDDDGNLTLLSTDLVMDPLFRVGQIKTPTADWAVTEWDPKTQLTQMSEIFGEKKAMDSKLQTALGQLRNDVISTGRPFSFLSMYQTVYNLLPAERRSYATLAALNAFIHNTMDPHTDYMSAAAFLENTKEMQGQKFFGIGAVLSAPAKKIFIEEVIQGSPAEKALLFAGDEIVQVDKTNVEGMNLDKAVDLIRGPEGSNVEISVNRAGTPIKVTITRGPISIKAIDSRDIKIDGIKLRYIKLTHFMAEDSCELLQAEIKDLESQGYEGTVFDVRNNSGGLITIPTCLGGYFVGDKPIYVSEDIRTKQKEQGLPSEVHAELERRGVKIGPVKILNTKPLIILQNGRSASASELFAGAMQDYHRAWIVGERSFGKGSIQAILPESRVAPGLMAKVTIGRFLQPSGRTNQVVGIEADFEVPIKPDATEAERFVVREGERSSHALKAQGPKWTQPRQQEVTALTGCLEKRDVKTQYAQEQLKPGKVRAADYQLMYAANLAACVLNTAPVPATTLTHIDF